MNDLSGNARKILAGLIGMTGSTWPLPARFPARGWLIIHLIELTPWLLQLTSESHRPDSCWDLLRDDDGIDALAELQAYAHILMAQDNGTWHGFLRSHALAAAVAHTQVNVDAQAHLALLAAALIWRNRDDKNASDDLCYRMGLHLRTLTERPSGCVSSYSAPEGLDGMNCVEDIVAALPRSETREGRDDAEIFTAETLEQRKALVALGALWRNGLGVSPERPRGVSRRGHGTRGAKFSSLFDLIQERTRERSMIPGTDGSTPKVIVRIPTALTTSHDDDDDDEWDDQQGHAVHGGLPNDVRRWPIAAAQIEDLIPAQADVSERRHALTIAIQGELDLHELASLSDEVSLDDGESIRARQAALELAPLWWHETSHSSPADRGRERLAMALSSVLGIPPAALKQASLRKPNNHSQAGLRITRTHGQVSGSLLWALHIGHSPFSEETCDPMLVRPASPCVQLAIHPVIAEHIAQWLEARGSQWQRIDNNTQALAQPTEKLKLATALKTLVARLNRGNPGLKSTAGHASGFFLSALERDGTSDPALIHALSPGLRSNAPIASVYTNVTLSHLSTIYLRTQACAWWALTGESITCDPAVAVRPGNVGSQRCLTRNAVQRGHMLLARDAKRCRRYPPRDAWEMAALVNAQVLLVLMRLIGSRGLRARRTLWSDPHALQCGLSYWTFVDKGNYRRSVPLDAVDQHDLQTLADILRRASWDPRLGEAACASLADAADAMQGKRTASEHGPIGQLRRSRSGWAWVPLTVGDITEAFKRHGLRMPPAGIRHTVRSLLAEEGHAPGAIDSLLGHHGWGGEDFRPFRHHSAPLLKATVMPLVHALRKHFGFPTHVPR